VAISCYKIEQNLTKISEEKSKNKFRPYIEYIYFPHFKNLTPFTRIDLNFPITVLVGANGTNKSSILKALEACCPNVSLGNRWFSTHIDPIRHKPNLPCFVYGYTVEKNGIENDAQVLYVKTYRKDDPDYWETGKFTAKYQMTPLPTDSATLKFWGLDKQRWSKIKKPKPIYLTFRESISAFDKFYYYGDSNPGKFNVKERRATIRRYSRVLNDVINKGTEKLIYRQKPRVTENSSLSEQGLEYVSYILGTNYTEIKLVKHTFYNCEGYTCKFIRNSINYSEAFAGSGEYAVIRIVKEILDAKPFTLILLDEPEVSLHPGAQEKLLEFIVEQTLRKKLQTVIASHSPSFVRKLPDESIKVLINDPISDQTKVIKQSCSSSEAFHYIGEPIPTKTTFIVEDILAKELVQYALHDAEKYIKENIDLKYYGGGAFDILNNSGISSALENSKNLFIFLDGDQKKIDLPESESLTRTQLLEVESLLNKFAGGELLIPKDSNENEETIIKRNIQLLDWFKNHVFYLPTELNPEGFIWTKSDSPIKNTLIEESDVDNEKVDFKLKFRKLSMQLYPDTTDLTSSEIFTIQRLLLNGIPKEDPDLKNISISITSAFSQANK
jgi:predicted ATPase